MKRFCDTSFLAPAIVQGHPHHARAWPAFREIKSGFHQGLMSAHSVAELYTSLTQMPIAPRMSPAQASEVILASILPFFEVVSIELQDYRDVITAIAEKGIRGAQVYDALILRCAEKCGADTIYTFNRRHFLPLAGPAQVSKIVIL